MSSSKANDNRKITIYDIAAEAGVSASTVSRVLCSYKICTHYFYSIH